MAEVSQAVEPVTAGHAPIVLTVHPAIAGVPMTDTQVRVKATAKLTSNGWRGILIIHRGEDTHKKFGRPRTSLDEAKHDAAEMLRDYQKAIGRDPLRGLDR